jgi:hypothetical protein
MTELSGIEVGICHQYNRRLEKQAEEQGLFEPLSDEALKTAWIEPIDYKTAKEVIEEYEYLGNMAAITTHRFGMYFQTFEHGKILGGVLCFGPEYSINLGHWDKFGLHKDNFLLLNRGVNKWWCPPNSNSWFISRATKELAKLGVEAVTATVDPMAGEIGTIYQSLNWNYIGSMRQNNPNVKGNRKRFAVRIDGKLYGSRAMRAKVGTQRKADILAKYPQAEFTYQVEKHRYVYYISDKKTNRNLKKLMEHLFLPYPKRGLDGT